MPRACILCTHRDQAAVQGAFRDGLSDRAIGRKFGLTHPSVAHHRREHLLRPLVAAANLLDRGRQVREERKQQLAAIAQGDPGAIAGTIARFSRDAQLDKVARAEERAARVGDTAEATGALSTAIQAVGQQLKAIEVGSKLAQAGGYGAPPRVMGEADAASRWTIQMVFPNAGKIEEIAFSSRPPARAATQLEIDATPDVTGDATQNED